MPDATSQMFVIISVSNPVAVAGKIKELKLNNFALKNDVWFVPYKGTSQELSEALEIRQGTNGTGLVCPITTYSGRAATELWEWFKVNWPQ